MAIGGEVAAAVPLSLKLVDYSDSSSSDEHVSPSAVDNDGDMSSMFEFPALSRHLNDSQLTSSPKSEVKLLMMSMKSLTVSPTIINPR